MEEMPLQDADERVVRENTGLEKDEILFRFEKLQTDVVASAARDHNALAGGVTHYYFNAPEPTPEVQVDGVCFAGRVGFVALDADGQVRSGYLL